MASPSGPPPIVYILTLFLLAGGGWYAYQRGLIPGQNQEQGTAPATSSPPSSPPTNTSVSTSNSTSTSTSASGGPVAIAPSALNTSLPDPSVIQMDGSVTMVKLIQGLRAAYGQKYPNLPTTYGIPDGKPNGSNKGLEGLLNNTVQIAATSRPLRANEAQAGIQAIPIAKDALAVVVGVNNPFQGGLTMTQLADIYKGKITNWSEVGGSNTPIKVLNRSPNSGTQDLFKSVVLLGDNFAPDGPNFTTFQEDVTTPILRALESNGIGYTTVAQAVNQKTVRIVPIDNQMPTDTTAIQSGSYPISRHVFLAVPSQTSPAARNFIELALSPQGQQIATRSEFIPLLDL
ncbi:MAG: phosphate ABC transporter substrate-binding protein [Cyanobacteriota bacterium]|nr:phosphate ABC transporter substrate-binding protein [Cyanobacteriota bacterium]